MTLYVFKAKRYNAIWLHLCSQHPKLDLAAMLRVSSFHFEKFRYTLHKETPRGHGRTSLSTGNNLLMS
jgi:hypothetical protein